jgi:Domain of unknown function (DUF4326)
MPANTRVVSRPTKYGNPFRVYKPPAGSHRPYLVDWDRKYGEPLGAFEIIPVKSELDAHEQAVRCFRDWLTAPEQAEMLAEARHVLAGLNLACWCRLELPCHADVLLDEVNR